MGSSWTRPCDIVVETCFADVARHRVNAWDDLGSSRAACRALAQQERSGRRHGVWVKTHCWQRSMYALEELVRGKHRRVKFDLSLFNPRNTWESKSCQPALWTLLEHHDFSHKILKTRITHEYYAQATTMATSRVIDDVATRRKDARRILDMQRAFLGRRVYQPQHVEAASGRDSARFRRMTRVLYGRRMAPRECLG